MSDLPLNALRVFHLVQQEGGVRAAARALGVAHSAVVRHLDELERWLGVPLLESADGRRSGGLTPQGRALADAVAEGLSVIDRTVRSLREDRSRRSVVLSTSPSVAARWLLPLLPEIEQRLPQVEVSVLVDQRLQDLQAAGIDLAIRMGRGNWPGLQVRSLMDDLLYPVMSPEYWDRHGRPSVPADLVSLRLLHDRDPNASWVAWRDRHGPGELDVASGPRLASTDLLLHAAAQGQGVALARHQLAVRDLAEGRLIRPIPELAVPVPDAYWLVEPKQPASRPPVRMLTDWLLERGASTGRQLRAAAIEPRLP